MTLFYLLMSGGGIIVAFSLLLVASIRTCPKVFRGILFVLSFLVLAAQGGCWFVAEGFGKATGGSSSGGAWKGILLLAAAGALGWCVYIVRRKQE